MTSTNGDSVLVRSSGTVVICGVAFRHIVESSITVDSDVLGTGVDAPGRPAQNTLSYIILGLLGSHPMTGYDIKRAFDRSLATYWNAGNSQIYTTLKALAARGSVSVEVVEQVGRPNRRVYRLTPHGNQELGAWLMQPVPDRFTKDEFLTKLFFCGLADDETALRHLQTHLAAMREQLAEMEWVLREYGQRPTRRPRLLEFQLLVRDYRQAQLQADIATTERAIELLSVRGEQHDIHT